MYNKDSMCISFSATRKKMMKRDKQKLNKTERTLAKVQNLLDLLQLISW